MFSGSSVRLAVKVRTWVPTKAEWMRAAQCVQVEEKERIRNFYFQKDAKAAMAGRLLMRFAVSKILNVSCASLTFDRTEKGKPILVSPKGAVDGEGLTFNVSHQGDYVVLAAERGRNVGVDVMKVEWPRNTPVSSFFKTMDRQFSSTEWSEIKRHEDEMDQLKVFYRLWCLKESIVKAYGTGIGFEVSRLDFSFKTRDIAEGQMVSDTEVDIDGDLAPEWTFEETYLDGHCVAVAATGISNTDPSPRPQAEGNNKKSTPFCVMDIQEVLAGCEPLPGSSPDPEYWELFSSKEEEPVFKK